MLHVVASSQFPYRRLTDYNENFVFSHCTMRAGPRPACAIDTYYQNGMDMSDYDAYVSGGELEYRFVPVISMTEAVERIGNTIAAQAKDTDEEIMAACACDSRWNSQVVKELNRIFTEEHLELECLDVYRQFGIDSTATLAEMAKTALRSEFVYPDDPVVFSYAIWQVLDGGIL